MDGELNELIENLILADQQTKLTEVVSRLEKSSSKETHVESYRSNKMGGEDYFNKHNFEGASEIEWLLCDLLDCKRIDLYVKFEEIVPQSKLSTLNQD